MSVLFMCMANTARGSSQGGDTTLLKCTGVNKQLTGAGP